MTPNIQEEIIEALVLTCMEKNPIDFRSVDEKEVKRALAAIKRNSSTKPAALHFEVTRKHFLCACLDFTEKLAEEHLIVGYGYRYGSTTDILNIHHVGGQERFVSVPDYIRQEIQRHHFHRTDGEVVIFHNHPRTGNEPEWLYTLKALISDIPIPSGMDRNQLQHHALNPVGLLRQLFGQGRVLFFLGESGLVKEFNLPRLMPFLEQMRSKKIPKL